MFLSALFQVSQWHLRLDVDVSDTSFCQIRSYAFVVVFTKGTLMFQKDIIQQEDGRQLLGVVYNDRFYKVHTKI